MLTIADFPPCIDCRDASRYSGCAWTYISINISMHRLTSATIDLRSMTRCKISPTSVPTYRLSSNTRK